MLRIALAGALMLASVGAYAQFNKCGRGFCPGGIFSGGGFSAPAGSITPSSSFILMIDNSSRILQADNASKICKVGGC
jgi:hypothetical protein